MITDELVEQTGDRTQSAREADVAIIGAGLSGSTAAAVLGRAGYRVVLVDRHAACPSQFKVENIGAEQAEIFSRLGLMDRIAMAATRIDHVTNARRGRVLDHTHAPHYSLRYDEIVRVVRSALPQNVECVVDRVTDIVTSAELQRVVLAKQGTIQARLVVLATGMGDFLRDKLGITSRIMSEKHSISFGFDLASTSGRGLRFPTLTYYGEIPGDRIDYISIFPIRDSIRANLFTYRDAGDAWLGDLMRRPKEALLSALPGLEKALGDFEVTSPVECWTMNLCEVEGHDQDGVVLIGDAFRSSCPATGTGVTRLLTDVERLCLLHAPNWLASPGMGREKIARFYQDPAKRATDARAMAVANSRRRLIVNTRLTGIVRRQMHFQKRRLLGWLASIGTSSTVAEERLWPSSSRLR